MPFLVSRLQEVERAVGGDRRLPRCSGELCKVVATAGDVTGTEDARYRGALRFVDLQEALVVQGAAQLLGQIHRRRGADFNEHTVNGKLVGPVERFVELDSGHFLVAQDLGDVALQHQNDVLFRLHLVHPVRLGAEFVATVHEVHGLGDLSRNGGSFHGAVATTQHGHGLVAVEERVAGGAVRYALAREFGFTRRTEMALVGAGGENDRLAFYGGAVAEREAESAVDLVDVVHATDFVRDQITEAECVLLEVLHKIGPADFHRARPVADFGRGLPHAAFVGANNEHFQLIASRIHGSGVTAATQANNEDVVHASIMPIGWRNVNGEDSEETKESEESNEPSRSLDSLISLDSLES